MSKRILLIDSDESFALGLQSAIVARGFTAITATNSEQGMTLARRDNPDLIVVCVEAQPTNGYMLCTRLKKDEQLKGIPVILTSANATPDSFEKHKKLKTRAEEYLIKPFEPVVMLQKASDLLGVPLPALVRVEPEQHEEIVSMEDEPLGLGDLVTGLDEPIQLTDSEAAEAHAVNDESVVVEEAFEVQVQPPQEPLDAPHDEDLQMFDRAFDALEMPGHPPRPDSHAFGALHLAPESGEGAQPDSLADGPAEFGGAFGDQHTAMSFDDSGATDSPAHSQIDPEAHAALEARVQQLEDELASRDAELDAAKRSAASTGELLKLKEARTRAEKEALRLKEELHGKEKELLELQEMQNGLETQAQQLKDEAVKREAAAKALQQRAEALAAAAKKFERELTLAREELKGTPALKAKIAEFEKTSQAHLELQKKHLETVAELNRQLEMAPELEKQKTRASELETELSGARELHETEVTALKGDLGNAQQEAAQHAENAGSAQEELERVRAEMNGRLTEAQETAARNEERAVKAYQKIKGDERQREKSRKAVQFALQLLEETGPSDGAEVVPEKQSA